MPKLEVPVEPEENLVVEEIRKAQGVTGELLWLAVRSRPDIAFAVSLMGRHLSKNPRWVVKVGRCVLEYLSGTPNRGLVYEPCKGDRGPNGTLPIVRHGELIEAYADISFAPQGGRSCQGIVVFYAGSVVQWEATRQPFCALSTAESELLGYCETMQLVQALESLLTVLHGNDRFEKLLVGDNSGAISILTKPDGPWRTRHLRLRSYALKEKLADSKGDWKLRHEKGAELIADFLTKPITVPGEWMRFAKFMGMLGPSELDVSTKPPEERPTSFAEDPEDVGTSISKVRIAKVAKLGMAMVALCSVAKRMSGRARDQCRVVLARMALSLGDCIGGQSLGPAAGVQHSSVVPVSCDDQMGIMNCEREEKFKEKIAKTKSHQDCQEVREDEPTQENLWWRKGQFEKGKGLREGNEPSSLKSILKSTRKMNGSFRKPSLIVERRVSWREDVEVVGAADGAVVTCSLSDTAGSSETAYLHYCPSGCPGSSVGSGDFAGSDLAMADHKCPGSTLKIAALRAKSGSSGGIVPWELEAFNRAPAVSKDSWVDAWMDRGWLIRSHGGARVRKFHPVHRGVPVNVDLLEGGRTTLSFDGEGRRTVHHDRWSDPSENLHSPKMLWRGWTFFKLRCPVKPSLGGHFVEGAGLPLPTSIDVVNGVQGLEHEEETSARFSTPGNSAGSSDGVGYAVGSTTVRGRIVCDQLPLKPSLSGPKSTSSPPEDQLSDDESWEKVSED